MHIEITPNVPTEVHVSNTNLGLDELVQCKVLTKD